MAIEIVLQGKLEKEEEREGFSLFLQELCDNKKIKMEDYDVSVMIDVCPEGYIECSYEGLFITIVAQTNVAGPGFHAFVCRFVDDILQEGCIDFEVSDPTKYYFERNFEDLKYTYFYQWLKNISTYVEETKESSDDISVSWPLEYYHPKVQKGSVITPMGYLPCEEFVFGDMEALAQSFFIWNNLEADALYYRNCALSLLWKECFFTYSAMNEYSDKIANMIIDYIEAAYDVNNEIALPLATYRMLCESVEREILIVEGNEVEIEHLGYRKQVVAFDFEHWTIPVHGCSEKTFDKSTQTLHFMAPYERADTPWSWMIKANAYTFEKDTPSFLEILEEGYPGAVSQFTFEKDGMIGKGVVQPSDDYFSLILQANCKKDTLFVECVVKDKEEALLLGEQLKGIRHRVIKDDKIKN